MGMDVLHCRSVPGVLKEAAMFALVYNLVRLVMVEAARHQQTSVRSISFIDALHGWPPLVGDCPICIWQSIQCTRSL